MGGYDTLLLLLYGCSRGGLVTLAGQVRSGRVTMIGPDPRHFENLLITRPGSTRDPTRTVVSRSLPDPIRGLVG